MLYLDVAIVSFKEFESHLKALPIGTAEATVRKVPLVPTYLDYVITDPTKIAAAKDWQTSKCTQEVKSILGFVGCYRIFCLDFATIARPLNILNSKEAKF